MTTPTPESESPIGIDEARGIELFRAPQRPPGVAGPERHISMAGAEMHGHPDSCCCHARCQSSGCQVPGATGGVRHG